MNKKELNVVSCFDGMSCGQESLKQLGIPVGKYYSSELDKYAMAVTQHNHPDTIQVGDITNWREWDIDWSEIDLIYGGSPCQGFSFAGKQLAFDDPRSQLFFVFVDIVNHIKSVNPNVKFMLENVRMKQEYLDVISEYMDVKPIKINSSLVSAQNRVRYYWTNIWDIKQPEDRGILLKDILEEGMAGENPLKKTERNKRHLRETDKKSLCTTATMYKGAGNNGMTLVPVDRCIQVGEADLKGHDYIKRVYSGEGKAPTLNANGGGNLEPKVAIGGAMRGRYIVDGKKADHTVDSLAGKTEQRFETRKDGKMNCLTSASKDSLVIMQTPRGKNKGGIKAVDGKVPTLTSNSWEHNNKLVQGVDWRKLTPLECERLQTVPDNYTLVPHPTFKNRMMSNSQRYKMLGNGWTVEVIKHIFKNL